MARLGTIVLRIQLAISVGILLVALGCGGSDSNGSVTSPGCQVITGVTTTSFPASGGTASISVATPSNCAWTAVSSAPFLTVTQGTSGSGDGVVQFGVAANTGAVRTATLTITGTAITITQAAP
jgi:hypothetical protein